MMAQGLTDLPCKLAEMLLGPWACAQAKASQQTRKLLDQWRGGLIPFLASLHACDATENRIESSQMSSGQCIITAPALTSPMLVSNRTMSLLAGSFIPAKKPQLAEFGPHQHGSVRYMTTHLSMLVSGNFEPM